MLSTGIVIFRETLEIAMILGIVLAATRGLEKRMPWIWGGLLAGIAGSGLVALFAETISNSMEGMGQELFNAMILFTAAGFIGWTVIWMKKHARHMVTHIREVGQGVIEGRLPLYSLTLIIGLAMLREGSEIVLFVYGMLLSDQTIASIIAGSIVGASVGTVIGVMLYYGLLKMEARNMLNVTGWMLILLVAGLSSQGAAYLTAAGYFPHLTNVMWDTSWLLSEDSVVGMALHGLIGYSDRPMEIQVMFYLGTLFTLLFIVNFGDRKKSMRTAIAMAASLLLALTHQSMMI